MNVYLIMQAGKNVDCVVRWARRVSVAHHPAWTPEERAEFDAAAVEATKKTMEADAFVEEFWRKREKRRIAAIMRKKED